ncbi:hypothetical protein [Psychroserpens algicola]|uniref:hypothetical protein n=1 Tax=Psychroserpens algicola TaxID=1719034 RepID=UPI001953EEF4|nr:hypothetical protein [Psychroserpens algicola]
MEELLVKLFNSLSSAFKENLKTKEIYHFENSEGIDVFKTLMFLKKNNNDLNKLMLEGSISMDELKYLFTRELIDQCFKSNYIIKGNLINNDKVFIGANGMFKLYSIKNYNIQEVFKAFDTNNFKLGKELSLKTQEKIWCVFLVLFGADNFENSFNTEGLSTKKLNNYHKFFISIEKEMEEKDISLGKKVGWTTGKDSVFRKFITNNVDLPKTSLYFKKGSYQYYLDLSKRKNAKYLLDLILDNYKGEQRLIANEIFYNVLKDLSFKISSDLGEMPALINKYIIEELMG